MITRVFDLTSRIVPIPPCSGRAEAERRLGTLGDRDYLQKLAEEW